MPELPEVESARTVIAERALHRTIAEVDDTDTWVCRPHAPGEIAAALVGRTLEQACRRGKSMWCELSGDGPVLGIHLGMSGRIVVDGAWGGDPHHTDSASHGTVADGDEGAGASRDVPWSRFAIRFEDGGTLRLLDKRRLGRVVLDPDLSRLGPDALDITAPQFRERVGRGTAPIKARLLDQHALAGVGNLLADQTLWQARLSPERAADELDAEELTRLRRELRAATRAAMREGGVHTGSLIRHRRPGGTCPRCGHALRRATIGGRTTWWCPHEQT